MTKTKEVWVNGKRHIATYDHGVLIKMTEVSDNNAESIKKSEATKGNAKVIWGNTSSTNAPKSDPRKREPTEDEYLIARVKSGKATRFETARLNARKKDMESGLSPYVSDDFNSVINDYNKLDNVKDDNQFNEIKNKTKKLRDDLDKYSKYHNLYGDDESRKAISDMNSIISSIDDEWGNFTDFNAYKGVRGASNISTYAELRQKRALLQRKRGVDGYNTDKINSELEALDKYGFNQKVIDSMTDKDWEYEKQRLQTARDNAALGNQKYSSYDYINKQYDDAVNVRGLTEEEAKNELHAKQSKLNDEFNYYNNLLLDVEELERTTKIERGIAEKWGKYQKAASSGILAKPKGYYGGEYDAVNYGIIPEAENVAIERTVAAKNQEEIDKAKLAVYTTSEEKDLYNYIHENISPEKASEYLNDLTPILNKRKSQSESLDAYNYGKQNPIIGTVKGVGGNILNAVAVAPFTNTLDFVSGLAGGEEIDPYDPIYQMGKNAQSRLQGVEDTIDSKIGKVIYSAGTQIAELVGEMFVASQIGGAIGSMASGANKAKVASRASNIANQVILSSKSMQDTIIRYKESGESDLAAVGMGMLSGLIEAYTERKSLSNLLKSPDIFKDMATKVKVGEWASKIGVDALKEGFEEVEANALNTIAALVFDYRDNDSFLSAIDKAKSEEKSDAEALAEAIKAVAPEYIESFVVGALAGGAFGAVNTASSINTVNNVMDMSAYYFWENDTSRQSVEKLLIDMGYTDEAEIAKAANAIVRKGNGRSISKDNEALFEDDVRLRGMLHGYAIAVDAEARRDTVSKVLDEARETETPEPTSTLVPKNTTATKPDAELTEEEIETRKEGYALINDDDADKSYRTRGRSGSKVYTYAVNKGGLIDELIKDGYSAEEARNKTEQLFRFMYNQGRINGNVDIAVKAASENIVSGYEAQAREFFVAGQMDAQGRLIGKTNARLVPNQTLKNMQSNGQINSLTVRAINALASKLGINIAFSDTMKGGALGSFNKKTGTLLISSKAKNKYFLTAVHESIHTIRTIHPESYNKMNEVVYGILKDNKAVYSKAWNKILSSYRKEATKDGKIDRDLINEELTAKVVSHLLTDEAYIKELAKTDRKGLQRIYDAIVDFFDKIFKRYSEDASPREAEFKDALKELQGEFNTIKAMYENALKETTNVQQSKMVLPESGDGADVLNSKAITKEDVKFIQSIGRKSLNDLTEEELKKLESIAQKYYKEMGVKSPFFRRWFGDWRAEDKSPVNVVIANNKIFENATNHKELTNLLKEYLKEKSIYRGNTVNEDTKFNIIIGAVGYNDTISYAIRELHKKYISFDDVKKRANLLGNIKELIESSVLLNSEIINDKDNPNRIIMHTFYAVSKYENENIIVKLKVDEFKDEKNPTKRFYNLNDIEIPSAGIEGSTPLTGTDGNKSEISDINTVSDLFSLVKTYDKDFKPKPCSLVLNEDGTPKIMYRGDAEEFTVFDRKKSKYSNLYGRGFYFTDSKAHAMQYGNAREFYLNIRNPLKPNQHKITQSQLTKLLELVAENEDYDIYNYGTTNVTEIVNSIYGKGDFEMLQDISATAIGDLVETIELFNAVNNTDYDGVILPTETVVYNPNNIKSVKSGGTFSSWDDDILYSKEDTDYYEAKESYSKLGTESSFFKHWFGMSVVVNEDGTPKIVFHGTSKGGFSDFDTYSYYGKYGLFGNGAYFTESLRIAKQYTSKGKGKKRQIYMVYLSIQNPIDMDTEADITKWNKAFEKFGIDVQLEDLNITNEKAFRLMEEDLELQELPKYEVEEIVRDVLESMGYDGITHMGGGRVNSDGIRHRVWIAFHPWQIKSTDNYGMFSENNNDIYYSKESTDDTSSENIDPGVQGTQAISDAAYFELKKEVQKKLDEHIKKYGAIKKGEDAVRDAQFPVQTSDDRYVRRFTRTAFEADSVTDEVAAEIAEEVANGSLWTTYSRITDKKSVDAALNRFKSVGYDKMLEEWEAKIASNERIEKGDIAKAMVLVQEAGKRGDMKTAMGLIAEIAAEGTRAGQLVQSLSLLKKLSGQANVYYIERTIKQIQKDIDDKYTGRKAKKHVTIKVPEDLLKKYREMYDREKKSGSQDHSGSDKILDDIMKNVAEQIPATWADKFNTWRYFAMLGNPRTHIRNLAGSTFFMPLILAKNMVAAIGEGLAAPAAKLFGKNMQRTKTLGGVLSFGGEYMRYGKKDAKKIEAMLRGEGKYSELQKIMQGRKIFTSKVSGFLKINQLVNANAKALDNEDWIFLKHNYARALTMYMKANKLSPDTITEKQLETARLYAVREAQKASFRDESALAKAIQRAEKSHKALGFAVGALMPFKQTPINVLKRGVEYSPAGVITTVGKGIKGVYEGKFSATEFIDGLGATLSGTGLCYLGVYLASQGLLFGPGDDDEENRMNILNGIQNYSLKIGNGTYTIDWASPAAMSLFVGCEIWNSLANKEERTFADIVDALMSITEPVFEMSMLEGLMSVFEAGVYATRSSEAAAEALTSIVPDYFSQFVPTILGQIARTIDPVRRKTYIDKNKNVPEWLQSFGQQMAKKFPGTSFLLDPYVNAKGETELNAEGNIFSRAMQNFFSPGYYKGIKSNEVDNEIARLYEKFGSDANGVIPKTVAKKIGKVNLSDEQYTEYQKTTGQTYYSTLKDVITSDYYKDLSDKDKVRLLEKAREYAIEKGKEAALDSYHSKEGWLMTAFETDGLYRYVLNEKKEGNFSEDDLSEEQRVIYEEDKDKIFADIIKVYKPENLSYELADKFYEDLFEFAEKVALEENSGGQYNIDTTWINTAQTLDTQQRAEFIYGRAIVSQYDDQDKANEALQNDTFISDSVRGYLLQNSFGANKSPSKLYSSHIAQVSNEVSMETYTKLWEKWNSAEKYKVGNKTVDKKDQVLPEINKLKISNAAKSRIYDSFGWGTSEKALKNVPWSYVPDSQSPDVLSKRVGQDISGKSSHASKNSPYNKNNNGGAYGQCVWYAIARTEELFGKGSRVRGNGNEIYYNAPKKAQVDAKPDNLKGNMLVSYKQGSSTLGLKYGHVIYIEAVDGDTVYYTEGGNYNMAGILRTATREQIMNGRTDDRYLGSGVIGFVDVTKY